MLRDVLKKDVVLEMIKGFNAFRSKQRLPFWTAEIRKATRWQQRENQIPIFLLPSSGHLAISSSEFVAVFVYLIKYRINLLIEALTLRDPSTFPFTVPWNLTTEREKLLFCVLQWEGGMSKNVFGPVRNLNRLGSVCYAKIHENLGVALSILFITPCLGSPPPPFFFPGRLNNSYFPKLFLCCCWLFVLKVFLLIIIFLICCLAVLKFYCFNRLCY